MVDLGPAATICSLSLGTTRAFRVRQTEAVESASRSGTGPGPGPGSTLSGTGPGPPARPIRTYEVNLAHNSLVLMNAGCQERFKHTYVPAVVLCNFGTIRGACPSTRTLAQLQAGF